MTLRRTDLPSSELMTLLDAWLPERRWYPVKGVEVQHVPWLSFALDVPAAPDPARAPRVVLHLLRLLGDGVDLVVQVPLVLEPVDAAAGTTGAADPAGTPPRPPGRGAPPPPRSGRCTTPGAARPPGRPGSCTTAPRTRRAGRRSWPWPSGARPRPPEQRAPTPSTSRAGAL